MKVQYASSIPKNINILKSKKYNQKLSFTSDKFIRQTTHQPSKEDKDFFNFLDKKGNNLKFHAFSYPSTINFHPPSIPLLIE